MALVESSRSIPTYTLDHKPPSWLFPVKKDRKSRTGADYLADFERFTADVRARGVQVPIMAVRRGERGEVIDGETRRRAALTAGLETVPIALYEEELSENDVAIAQLQLNAQRRDFTELELAALYVELMTLNGWSQVQLARTISVSPAQVSKVLAISTRLGPEVQAMVAAGQVAPRAAYALSRLSDIPLQVDLAKKFKEGLLCVESLEGRCRDALHGRQKAQKPMKLSHGGVTAIVKGNPVEALKAFLARVGDALKRIEKDNLPPDLLGGLVR